MTITGKEKPRSATEMGGTLVGYLERDISYGIDRLGPKKEAIDITDIARAARYKNRNKYGWANASASLFSSKYTREESVILVLLPEGESVAIPWDYSSWAKEIEESKYIIGYTEEDEQTGEHIYYDSATWYRSIRLLVDMVNEANTEGHKLPAPRIYDGPKGSIDIRWKNECSRLLVNVPADPNHPIGFHGDDDKQQMVKGKLHKAEDLKDVLITILKSV